MIDCSRYPPIYTIGQLTAQAERQGACLVEVSEKIAGAAQLMPENSALGEGQSEKFETTPGLCMKFREGV